MKSIAIAIVLTALAAAIVLYQTNDRTDERDRDESRGYAPVPAGDHALRADGRASS
ncbi:MAG: hypothetical protein AAF771_02645 [Pseudomonadota bacterium]